MFYFFLSFVFSPQNLGPFQYSHKIRKWRKSSWTFTIKLRRLSFFLWSGLLCTSHYWCPHFTKRNRTPRE